MAKTIEFSEVGVLLGAIEGMEAIYNSNATVGLKRSLIFNGEAHERFARIATKLAISLKDYGHNTWDETLLDEEELADYIRALGKLKEDLEKVRQCQES